MNLRSVIIGLVSGLSLVLAAFFGAGEALSRPARESIGEAPLDLHAAPITIRTESDGKVAGWLVPGNPGSGAVLLLHGVRSNRLQILDRARLLSGLGYEVLIVDLPAHGESTGDRITFGVREAEGVRASLDYLRRKFPKERIGVIGVSLGAASVVLAKASPAPDAVVLESMFPTIAEAVSDRLVRQLGPAGSYLAPPLLWQLPLRLGIEPEQIQPIVDISRLNAPVLIASGSADEHTTLAESKRIFEAAHEPKQFWVVQGAAHVDLYRYEPKAYRDKILPFLVKYLRRAA